MKLDERKKTFFTASFSRFLLWRCVGRTTIPAPTISLSSAGTFYHFYCSPPRKRRLPADGWRGKLGTDSKRIDWKPPLVVATCARSKDETGAGSDWMRVLFELAVGKFECYFCANKKGFLIFIQYRRFQLKLVSCTHLLINKVFLFSVNFNMQEMLSSHSARRSSCLAN